MFMMKAEPLHYDLLFHNGNDLMGDRDKFITLTVL
jgi:hypothetical protein